MIRLILSIVIVVFIITVIIIPFTKRIRQFFKKAGKQIDKAFAEEDSNSEDDHSKKSD